MRIVVLLSSLYTGGAEFSTLSFYGWLMKKGYKVTLVCRKKANPAYDPSQFGFKEVHYLDEKSIIKSVRGFNKIIKMHQPHLVHSVLFEANLIGRFSRILNKKFVHLESLVNETYSSHRLSDPQVTRIKLAGYRVLDFVTQYWGVDHFHANGKTVAAHYKDKLGIAKKRLFVIPRGRELNPLVDNALNKSKIREEVGLGGRLLLINVARHEYQKAQDVLIDAIIQLKEDADKVLLLLVGREGKLTTAIRKKIKDNGLESCVILLGHRNDVSSLLAASDIFIFPSRFEGLPGALIEAEAAGLPIVASDIPNNHEVAQEGVNALFFSVDDSAMLARQIKKLIDSEEMRKKMSSESLNTFKTEFLVEEVHEKMLVLLNKLVKP